MQKAVKPVVTFFHRKPRVVGNYSVEFIFQDVRRRLRGHIVPRVVNSSFESSGLFKRIYNCIEAFWKQGGVNHVTGDVNYIGLFLSGRRTIHTILDCVQLQHSTGLRHRILRLFWLTIPVRRSAYITAISSSTRNEILKYAKCPPGKVKVIYVAISDSFKRVDRTFNKARPRILQIGTAPNKNIPRLAEALEGIPCLLEIVGKRNEDYVDMLKSRNIEFEYKSGLTDEEMMERYADADIVSLVSVYEGFGMPILEANAVGRPVVTSDIFSMPEVAGDAAHLVDPFNVSSIREGFIKIISDDQYRKRLIENGFQNIARFDADKIAGQYLELYKEIANRSAK